MLTAGTAAVETETAAQKKCKSTRPSAEAAGLVDGSPRSQLFTFNEIPPGRRLQREPGWSQSERDATRKPADGRIQPSVAAACSPSSICHFPIYTSPPAPTSSSSSPVVFAEDPRCSASTRRLFVSRFVRSPGGGGDHVSWMSSPGDSRADGSTESTVDSWHKQWKLLRKSLGQGRKK